jgi:hypothetical protein
MCESNSRCGGVLLACNETIKDQCVDQLEDFSSGCQNALGDFYDCVNDLRSCDEERLQRECGSEAGNFAEKCAEEDPFEN